MSPRFKDVGTNERVASNVVAATFLDCLIAVDLVATFFTARSERTVLNLATLKLFLIEGKKLREDENKWCFAFFNFDTRAPTAAMLSIGLTLLSGFMFSTSVFSGVPSKL